MIIGVYGYKKTGKTSLIEKLIKNLPEYKICTIKNIHSNISIDQEGTDTYIHSKAGAICSVGLSKDLTTIIFNKNFKLEEILEKIRNFDDFDLIILEGFKNAQNIKKISVGDIEEKENTLFRFENNFNNILDYIKTEISIERIYKKLPKLDCGKCGFDCKILANLILNGEKNLMDCKSLSKKKISIKINGQEIKIGEFVDDFVRNTVCGMVSNLKGVEDVENVIIEIENRKND